MDNKLFTLKDTLEFTYACSLHVYSFLAFQPTVTTTEKERKEAKHHDMRRLDPAGKILDFSISILPFLLFHVSEVMPIRESPDTVVSDGITDSHGGQRSLNLIELEERYRIGMVSPNTISFNSPSYTTLTRVITTPP